MNGTLTLNGQPQPWRDVTVAALMAELGFGADGRGVAVAVNGAIVPVGTWGAVALVPGDSVEVVTIVKGG